MRIFLRSFLNFFKVITIVIAILLAFLMSFIFYSEAYGFEEEKCKIIQVKTCAESDERIVDGFSATNVCWRYEIKYYCLSKEQNNCSSLEANRGCREISTNCLEEGDSELALCKKREKKFSCGEKLAEKPEVKHIDTQFHLIKDEKDLSNCSKEEIDEYCEVVDEICIEPEETRNINGKEITKDCWKWDRKYACRSDTIIDECKSIPKNCQFTGEKECLHSLKIDGQETCDHWELKYSCSETKTYKKDCIANKFCIGGICEINIRNSFNDFASSMSALSVLASIKSDLVEGCKCPDGKQTCEPGEIDTGSCRLFTGNGKICSKAWNRNCCANKGFFKDIWQCGQMAKDLFINRQAGLCHPVGSWRGKKLKNFERLKKYESHCCFKSKLAKIIQVQGREQLGIGWGDKKNPDCRSLTLEEIQRIDFNKIDFSELFHELKDKAHSAVSKAQSDMQDKLKNSKTSVSATSELMNQKIKNFYKTNSNSMANNNSNKAGGDK